MRLSTVPLAAAAAALALTTAAPASRYPVPPQRIAEALCLHAGRHYTQVRTARGATYLIGGHAFAPATPYDDVVGPDGSNGEGAWDYDGAYGGGLSFMLGTWHRAGGWARTLTDIARASPSEQILRAWIIWKQDGGSWREWPATSRACGYR